MKIFASRKPWKMFYNLLKDSMLEKFNGKNNKYFGQVIHSYSQLAPSGQHFGKHDIHTWEV